MGVPAAAGRALRYKSGTRSAHKAFTGLSAAIPNATAIKFTPVQGVNFIDVVNYITLSK
jgi:hypothetical protein